MFRALLSLGSFDYLRICFFRSPVLSVRVTSSFSLFMLLQLRQLPLPLRFFFSLCVFLGASPSRRFKIMNSNPVQTVQPLLDRIPSHPV